MRQSGLLISAIFTLTACATGASDTSSRDDVTRSVTRPVLEADSRPGEIRECGTPGAPNAEIAYPPGWTSRVSQAETEDELLGGGARVETEERVKASSLPSVLYPPAALSPPQEARCEVKFNLSTQGEPSNILAACSSPLFTEEVKRIISGATFEPLRVNGSLAKGVNVVFPYSFCLSNEFFGS
ncbi:MAG: energy transducer TonB [Pseudomonadota bacterium]